MINALALTSVSYCSHSVGQTEGNVTCCIEGMGQTRCIWSCTQQVALLSGTADNSVFHSSSPLCVICNVVVSFILSEVRVYLKVYLGAINK